MNERNESKEFLKELYRMSKAFGSFVSINRNALRTFWDNAKIDAEQGKETGALLCGRIDLKNEMVSFKVSRVKGITHGMSKQEIEKRFSSLEKLLKDEYGIDMKVEGAVKLKRFLTNSYWPKGEIIGDIHTHPNVRQDPFDQESEDKFFNPIMTFEGNVIDVNNNKRMCESLAKALEKDEYYYLSLLMPSPYPDTKLLWDILFEEVAKKENRSETEVKQEYFIEMAEKGLKDVESEINNSVSRFLVKKAKKPFGTLLRYIYEFAYFSTPYCKPYSLENYKEFLERAKEIYERITHRKDYPKNRLLEWMRKRDFLYDLAKYNFIDAKYSMYTAIMFIKAGFSHFDGEKTKWKNSFCYLEGKREVEKKILEFLEDYEKHFNRPYNGMVDLWGEVLSMPEIEASMKEMLSSAISYLPWIGKKE